MRSISPFLLTLLLCNSCSSDVVEDSDSNNVGVALSGHLHTNSSGKIKQKMKFTDLISDVKLLIFDEMNFDDLVNMGAVNLDFNSMALRAFYRKYRDHTVWIQNNAFKIQTNGRRKFRIWKGPRATFIGIDNYELALTLLQYFGDLIQKLHVDSVLVFFENELNTESHRSQLSRCSIIQNAVNKYTSKSLIDLYLTQAKESELEQFVSFERVEELSLSINEEKIDDNIQLSSLFPKLRRLEFRSYDRFDFKLINCEFPLLKEFDLKFSMSPTNRACKQIEGMLRRNPQIRTLTIEPKNFPDYYLKIISELLPSLESLTIDHLTHINTTVHFEHVKHFALRSFLPGTIGRVSFTRLESIYMEYSNYNGLMQSDNVLEEWVQFFRNHQTLSVLNLYTNTRMLDNHLLALTDGLPNLVELHLQISSYINPETIDEIIQKHGQIRKFVWRLEDNEVADMEWLQDNFENDWDIRSAKKPLFWMERKN